jgi:hypothetical protein
MQKAEFKSMKREWKKSEIEQVENLLELIGDLLVKDGQKNLTKAIKALPKKPEKMQEWCDEWLTEKGCKRLYKKIAKK